MNKSPLSRIAAALSLSLIGMAFAQEQQPLPPETPSTSEAEGTAADRTRPGETPTQGAPTQQEDPRPATSPTEGTAADRTAPGDTASPREDPGKRSAQHSDIIGAAVVSTSDAPLGKVVDVVFDATDQPAFVVIASEGKSTAMPYSVASSMMTSDKIVVDRSRLQAAPKVKEGQWKSEASGAWKKESSRYWERG